MAQRKARNPPLLSTDIDVDHDNLCMPEAVRNVSLADNITIMSEEHYSPSPLTKSGRDTRDLGYLFQPQGYFPPPDLFYHLPVQQPALETGTDDTSFSTSLVDRSYQSSTTPESERRENLSQTVNDSLAWSELPMGEWQPDNPFGIPLNHCKWDTETEMEALAQDERVRLNEDGNPGPVLLAAVARPEHSEREPLYHMQLQAAQVDDVAMDKLTTSCQYYPPQTLSPATLGENTDHLTAETLPPLSHNQTTGSPYEAVLHSHREAQDQYLIQSKLSGMSYKEIKAKGQFKEAESTLRGRFRTLTKSKDQRVRKPQWQERDVQLLRQAVFELTHVSANEQVAVDGESAQNHSEASKIPWMKVAEYVALHGSYHFGNATCRRKWDEIKGAL
ncbi:hypothetical protein MMC30_008583 [Trapelia coarctata]|nr:hypothetical protein [Trapelia coarctata]